MELNSSSPSPTERQLIVGEQVRLLYQALGLSALISVINAFILSFVIRESSEAMPVFAWLGAALLVTLLRAFLSHAYSQWGANATQSDAEKSARWGTWFDAGVVAAGLVWGSAALLLFTPHSTAHQVFLAFVIGGMGAGAVYSLPARRFPVYAFLLLSLAPLSVRFLLTGTHLGMEMGGMVALYLLLTLVSAERSHRNILQNIVLRMHRELSSDALLRSEARFRELFEGNRSIQLILDPGDGRIIEANHAAERFYGYSREQLLGMSIMQINIQTPEQIHAEMTRAESEQRDHFLFRHRLAGGEVRDVEVHSGPIDWNGKRVLYSIIHDVTRRKLAEDTVQQTTDILHMVASGKPPAAVYDAVCRMYETLHPGTRTCIMQLLGKRQLHCVSPSLPADVCRLAGNGNSADGCTPCARAALRGEELCLDGVAGDERWGAFSELAGQYGLHACRAVPVIGSDGRPLGGFAVYHEGGLESDESMGEMRDISRLLAIAMQKEQRENLLRKLSQAIEQAGESVIITDSSGLVEYVNPSFTAMTGFKPEEVIGQHSRALDFELDEAAAPSASGGHVWQGNMFQQRKDGSEYPTLTNVSAIRDEAGEIMHYVAIQQDMTEMHSLEAQFRQSQKMEALGTLVGGIAHDFNNMLAGITGNLYLVKQHVQGMPQAMQRLQSIERLAFRAADMIQQLLAFARKGQVDMQAFSLTTFLKEAVRLHEAGLPENIRFERQLCSEELSVRGDATQLQQVLLNLLSNARDATAEVEAPRITLRLEPYEADEGFIAAHPGLPGKLAHLEISDNGCGIDKGALPHVFEPFFTTKEVGRGTGLGLAMTYGAIRGHGGVIEVDSRIGEGTTVHVYLPLLQDDGLEEKVGIADAIEPGRGELILVTDDDADVRQTARMVLESIGYRVLEAADGEQAVARIEEADDDIALVILDVVMPGMGGMQAARRIRQINPAVRIVFATGYDREAVLENGLPWEDCEVLSKPYSIDSLASVIGRQLAAGRGQH